MGFPDFRVLVVATLFMGAAYVGESVVLGWLLLDLTDSPFIVALGIALRALPNFLLGVPGGALVDRLDRRTVLRIIGPLSGINAIMLGLLLLGDFISVPLILLSTFVGGSVRSIGQTARQSYAFDIAGP